MTERAPDGDLAAGDLTVAFVDDAAFVAVVDVASYPADLPDWTFESLTAKVVAAASAGQLVAWGNPEQTTNVRLTCSPLPPGAQAGFGSSLVVTGPLCLAGYTALTMAAQFAPSAVSDDAHVVFALAAGRHRVEVGRYFEHADGEQFAEEVELDPDADHYVVSFTPDDRPAPPRAAVPWAAPAT